MDIQFEDFTFIEPTETQKLIRKTVTEDLCRLLQNPVFFATEQGNKLSRQ